MDIFECINTRRSVRCYEDRPVSAEDMDRLLALGVKAPTASGLEPWGFVILNDKAEIDRLSEEIKAYFREHLEEFPELKRYEAWMSNPKFHVFNRAHTVLVIYGKKSRWSVYDCSLAAENIMLAAHAMGIGSCWIGFSHYMLNTEEFKAAHHVPEDFELVCPMSMGYREFLPEPSKRKAPVIFSR